MEDRSQGDGSQGDEPGQEPEVGSVAEEAAKLLGALTDWAGGRGHEVGEDLGATFRAGLRSVDEHVATGAAECQWCPVCRTVHLVREAGPDLRTHLADAASSLFQALTGLLDAAAERTARGPEAGQHPGQDAGQDAGQHPGQHAGPRRTSGVERIDLDDTLEDGADQGPDEPDREEDG